MEECEAEGQQGRCFHDTPDNGRYPELNALDRPRHRVAHPIVLNSVYRNEVHNAAVGGVKGSQHRLFRTADFRVVGHGGPQDWAAALRQMRGAKLFQGGIGVYWTFVHVDTRGWNADW